MSQLHYMFHTLFDVARQEGTVLLGQVQKVEPQSRTLAIRVTRRWPAKQESSAIYPDGSPTRAKVGTVFESQLYGGVEWTDPDESPIEMRLAGYATASDFAIGNDVLLVASMTVDAMAATTRNIQLVEMAFDADKLRAYLESASSPQLIADLSCPHMQKAALQFLERSGRLTAGDVLAAFDGTELRTLIEDLYEAWSYPQQARFMTQALKYFETSARRPWGDRLALICKKACDMVWDCQGHRDKKTWEALGALCALLDPRHKEEADAMYSMDFRMRKLAEDDARTLPLSTFNALTASYLLFEYSDTGSFAYYLSPQLKTMTPADRAAFLELLSAEIEREKKDPRPRLRKLDKELYEVLTEAFRGLSSPEVNASLATIAGQLGTRS
ncbi:MAG: hypothetical protein ABIJ09_23645 [Pseudomonadota bacterium]